MVLWGCCGLCGQRVWLLCSISKSYSLIKKYKKPLLLLRHIPLWLLTGHLRCVCVCDSIWTHLLSESPVFLLFCLWVCMYVCKLRFIPVFVFVLMCDITYNKWVPVENWSDSSRGVFPLFRHTSSSRLKEENAAVGNGRKQNVSVMKPQSAQCQNGTVVVSVFGRNVTRRDVLCCEKHVGFKNQTTFWSFLNVSYLKYNSGFKFDHTSAWYSEISSWHAQHLGHPALCSPVKQVQLQDVNFSWTTKVCFVYNNAFKKKNPMYFKNNSLNSKN